MSGMNILFMKNKPFYNLIQDVLSLVTKLLSIYILFYRCSSLNFFFLQNKEENFRCSIFALKVKIKKDIL